MFTVHQIYVHSDLNKKKTEQKEKEAEKEHKNGATSKDNGNFLHTFFSDWIPQ